MSADAAKTRLLGPPHRARGRGAAKAGRRPGGVTLRGDTRFHHRDRRRSGPGAGARRRKPRRRRRPTRSFRRSFPAPTSSPSKASSRRAPPRGSRCRAPNPALRTLPARRAGGGASATACGAPRPRSARASPACSRSASSTAATLEELEDVLVRADLGIETAARIAAAIGEGRYDKEISTEEVKRILAGEVEKVLAPVAMPLAIDRAKKPFVLLMIGRQRLRQDHHHRQARPQAHGAGPERDDRRRRHLPGGGDRAAQGLGRTRRRPGGGARAGRRRRRRSPSRRSSRRRRKAPTSLMIDTAGRLQNKAGLMAELEKIVRVIRKVDPEAPHATLLVLDATVGPERGLAGRAVPQGGRRDRPRHDQARRHRPRRHPRRAGAKIPACRCTSSASARASRTSSRSRRALSPAPSPGSTRPPRRAPGRCRCGRNPCPCRAGARSGISRAHKRNSRRN